MGVQYVTSSAGITPGMLAGFFEGWANPATPQEHLRILRGSTHIVLALEDGRVVGFINAVGDGFWSAYIPLLEVAKDHRGRGIGSELVRRMLSLLEGYYAVDLTCDAELRAFYERFGFKPAQAMVRRRYSR